MKKLFIATLSILMCLTLTACGSKDDEKKQTSDAFNLSNVQSKIEDLGIKCEKTEVAFDMVGAKDGFKLNYNENHIEIYQFDKNSEVYKEAEKNQKLTISSMNMSFDAKVKNGYAYIIDDNFEKHNDIVKILDELN